MSVKGFKVGTAASEQYDYNYLDNKPNLSVYATKTEVAAVDDAALAAYPSDTATGTIASFSDGADNIPMKSALCAINPLQDLHGYDAPWPAGGGKNLLPPVESGVTINGVTFVVDEQGVVTATGAASGGVVYVATQKITLQANTAYILSGCPVGGGLSSYRLDFRNGTNPTQLDTELNNLFDTGSGVTFTPTTTHEVRVGLRIANGYAIASGGVTFKPMIRLASESDATFTPYSNICPISGFTGMTLSHSGADTSDPTTLSISWETEAGTVYGGTLDVVSGLLTATMASVDLGTQMFMKQEASQSGRFDAILAGKAIGETNIICSQYKTVSAAQMLTSDYCIRGASVNENIVIVDTAYSNASAADFTTAMSGVQLVYELATPQTYQLTPTEVDSLLGVNNLWHDANGNTTANYRADTALYIDKKIAAIGA